MSDKKNIGRNKKTHVKSARGRTTSSTKWLKRQLNDPYVVKAQHDGYRSRAAYKIVEINEKADILKPGMMVIDLGAAPGGWCQVAANIGCKVIGLDLLPIDPISDVKLFEMDFMDDDAPDILKKAMKEMGAEDGADIIMSDMAPNTIGHKNTDHIRIMALVELAYHFALEVLKPEGVFVAKVRQGGTQDELLTLMKKSFKKIKHIKPPASRKDSSETYVVATGFKGNA